MSWIVLLRTCPSVSTPVMFGGGMTMENAGREAETRSGWAVKQPASVQRACHLASTAAGS